MRKPDKPGTYRIVPKNGAFMLTGVRSDGTRVKVPGFPTHAAADDTASSIWPKEPLPQTAPKESTPNVPLDDYGLPPLRPSPAVVAATAPIVGAGPPGLPGLLPKPVNEAEEKAKKELAARKSKSLMELAGVCWASGDVWLARKLTERAGKIPVNPNPKQVTDLRDSVKETLTEWFGDKEVKPWQMMFLLTIALPMSMLLQSPKKPEESATQPAQPKENLRSV